ncbi:MAG: hypothetical protein M3033_14770 [Acidobacteriota bacterium]|nr:hypothetical protein [Acidobacteriota bacterium]
MFEIRENTEIENYEKEYPYHLIRNGEILEFAGARKLPNYYENENLDYGYEIEAFNETSKMLASYPISAFPEAFTLHFIDWIDIEDFTLNLLIHLPKGSDVSQVNFQFLPNLIYWKHSYSFFDFAKTFQEILRENFPDWNLLPTAIEYKNFTEIEPFIFHNFGELAIKEELKDYEKIITSIHKKTISKLNSKAINKSLVSLFNFPETIKNSCEQYLIYFAQFLKDLGINATSNLKEEAGKVLFSVTPIDDVEALDKIREALAVYLHLPESPIIYNESFAAMRLQQQIENLQHSQRMTEREIRSSERELRLAQTVIEHQDKIILQKDTTIEQQNRVIKKISSKSIMMDSLENKEEFEKVFDGLEFGEIKILKDKLGIKLNPVTSLKSLGKKLSGGDEEITSLNLNEESDKNN